MPKVLVVEDQFALREGYVTILKRAGYDVFEASDGMSAVLEAERVHPDIILLDLLMPFMDGLAFLRKYDVRTKHTDVSVVIFSNSSAPNKVQEAMEMGAKRYLLKAIVSPKKLLKIVEEELAARAAGAAPNPSS
jgi:two-component system response regulator (stage 0 sporulation protein F)